MSTNYYRKYAAEGRCVKCGAYLPEGFKYKECDRCRENKNLSRRRRCAERNARKEAEKRNAGKKIYTLDEVSRMARDRGISYGQMVILIEQGKI